MGEERKTFLLILLILATVARTARSVARSKRSQCVFFSISFLLAVSEFSTNPCCCWVNLLHFIDRESLKYFIVYFLRWIFYFGCIINSLNVQALSAISEWRWMASECLFAHCSTCTTIWLTLLSILAFFILSPVRKITLSVCRMV